MKKTALTLAAAAGLSLGVAGQVHAGALASSVVEFTNFQVFLSSDGTTKDAQVDASDLGGPDGLSFTNTADVSATLSGTNNNDSGSGTPLDLYEDVGTTAGIYSDNDFSHLSSTSGLPTGNFSIADTEELGFPITGLGAPTDADVSTASYVSLEGSGDGSSQSNNGLTASIEFTAQTNDFLIFEFDLDTFVEAFLDLGDQIPAFAEAGWSIVMTLEDITGGIFLLDFGLDCAVSRTAPGGATGVPTNGIGSGDCGASGVDLQAITTGALTIGNDYQFTARIQTVADAEFVRVPEPSMTAIFGAGLLSLGLLGFSRRRQTQS